MFFCFEILFLNLKKCRAYKTEREVFGSGIPQQPLTKSTEQFDLNLVPMAWTWTAQLTKSLRSTMWLQRKTFLERTLTCKILVVALIWCGGFSYTSQKVRGRRARLNSQVLTFARIGQEGRLGNQLFQIATTIGLAESNGYAWGFFSNVEDCSAGRLFKLHGVLGDRTRFVEYVEQSQSFYEIQLPRVEAGVVSLLGYFQDYHYFEQSLQTLKRYLVYPKGLAMHVLEHVPEVASGSSVALHVRRGDFVELNYLYNVLSVDYYLNALSLIHDDIDTIIIVTDDKLWCQVHLVSRLPYRTVFSPFDDDLSDFMLLHLSKTVIIANSSFSWWAAFLKYVWSSKHMDSEDVNVFAPETWYNSSGYLAHLNRDSFFPPKWTRVAI